MTKANRWPGVGFRTAAVGVLWSTALAVALGSGLPAVAAEVTIDKTDGVPTDASLIQADIGTNDSDVAMAPIDANPPPEPIAAPQGPVNANPAARLRVDRAAAGTGFRNPNKEGAPDDRLIARGAPLRLTIPGIEPYFTSARDPAGFTHGPLAQFQVPGKVREGTPQDREDRPVELIKEITFSYAYGSDSEITYMRNPDLNNRVRDNSVMAAPTLFGLATYRPSNWLEATLEMTLSKLFAIQEEDRIVLPSGEIQVPAKKPLSLLIDQAYLKFKGDPIEFTVGRKNFEDARLWLYDAALDSVGVKLKHGNFQTDVDVGRENWRDMDLLTTEPRGTIKYYILHSEYRGIEDHKFAGYAITLRDTLLLEGEPLMMGVRAIGRPTDRFNYWTELGVVRGTDPLKQDYSARAVDVGGTYRFTDVSMQPSVTLGYAYGSGDDNPNDNKNREFRQTGLQSNEARFGGLTQFKAYGETLDPELSNLQIFTLGFGLRPASNAFVDLVYHRYRLNKIGNDLRSSALTALVSQDDSVLSKRVGSEIDIILGFRNLFGIKRFGFEVRAGLFLPGDAYRVEEGDPSNPTFRKGDKAVSALAVFIY